MRTAIIRLLALFANVGTEDVSAHAAAAAPHAAAAAPHAAAAAAYAAAAAAYAAAAAASACLVSAGAFRKRQFLANIATSDEQNRQPKNTQVLHVASW